MVKQAITLVLWLSLIAYSFAAEAPDNNLITRSSAGETLWRTLRPTGEVADRPPYAAGEILVKFKNSVPTSRRTAVHRLFGGTTIRRYAHVQNLERIRLATNISVEQAVRLYRSHPDVLYAEPNYQVEIFAAPNDPSFTSQWSLQNTGQSSGLAGADIKAVAAWNITTGSSDIVVAVIDTGVDYTHQDLAANIWRNEAECSSDGIDNDGNGYVDDCHGIDTANADSDPMDDVNHGTHVAGIIGAVGNNAIGVAGLNWNVKIMPCKFIAANGFGFTSGAIACLDYIKSMKDRGVNIVASNNSWGGVFYSEALYDAIDVQRQAGILFIASAGNNADSNDRLPQYPAGYHLPNVISVAASDRFDGRAWFSSYGRASVHLGAPGDEILSTTPGDTYSVFSGTSMAAPHVAGVAALLKAQNPSRDWKAIKNLILAGGDPLLAGDNRFNMYNTIAQRRLSALGSMNCANSVVLSRLEPVSTSVQSSIGGAVDLSTLHINCAASNGDVQVTVQPGGQVITLKDNGLANDKVAGDGIYSAVWSPTASGTYTLTFPDASTVTVSVDPHLKAGFPVTTPHLGGAGYCGPQGVATLVGNIDSDPQLEIVVSALAAGPLYAWKWDGSLVPGWPLEDDFGVGSPALGKLSHDAIGLDVFSGFNFGWLSAYRGDGTPLPNWPLRVQPPACWNPVLVDVDGDGLDEIFIGELDGALHAYHANGSELPGWPILNAGPYTNSAADLDGDGVPDIISTSIVPNGSDVTTNLAARKADGSVLPGFPFIFNGYHIIVPVVGDVDGDGKPEIVFAIPAYPSASLVIVSNTGVIKRTISLTGGLMFGSAPALADLDGDGVPEIVVQTDTAINVLRGDGTSFPGWPVDLGKMSSVTDTSPVVGDVDGDGLPDVVITAGDVRVYNRNGGLLPGFPKQPDMGEGGVPAIADLDLDGRNEIIVTGTYWNGIGGDYPKVWVYDLGGPPHGAIQWGQFMGGPRRQGYYAGGFTIPSKAILNVAKSGAGVGTVTATGINCGTDCTETFAAGSVVTLSAAAAPGSRFEGWSGGGCSGAATCIVKLGADTTVTAIFRGHIVTVLKAGTGDGSVVSLPHGIACGTDCVHEYTPGAVPSITLSAFAERTRSTFGGWSGASCTQGTCTITLDGDKTITAYFYKIPALFVQATGDGGGKVTSSPAGIDCGTTCVASFENGATVTLTPVLSNAFFNGWTGTCTIIGTSCTLNMTVTQVVTADFRKILDIQTPAAAASWKIGSKQSIRWSMLGGTGLGPIKQVKIDISRDGGSSWTSIIKKTANSSSKPWKVTGPATGQAKIRVCSLNGPALCDVSDTFRVQ